MLKKFLNTNPIENIKCTNPVRCHLILDVSNWHDDYWCIMFFHLISCSSCNGKDLLLKYFFFKKNGKYQSWNLALLSFLGMKSFSSFKLQVFLPLNKNNSMTCFHSAVNIVSLVFSLFLFKKLKVKNIFYFKFTCQLSNS